MIPLSVLKELFNHHYWARDLQLQTCAGLSQELFTRPLGSSFSSLRDTLVHMVITEWVWLERWQGRSPNTCPTPEEFTDLKVLAERWRAVERDMRSYLAGINILKLGQDLTYTNLKGEAWTYPLWEMLFHLINHQSYHRGQVTTLLRQLGATPVMVDYLAYRDALA